MNIIKKIVAVSATASMVLWSFGTALPVGAVTIADGDLVKTADSSAVYYIQGAYKRVFPHANVYHSWGYTSDFSTVKTVTSSELSAYSDANAMVFRDGSLFRGTAVSLHSKDASAVFYVENAMLRPVLSEDVYQALFKDASWSKVTWVPDDLLTKFNYSLGSNLSSSSTHPDGSLVRYTGTTQVYVVEGGLKRAVSDAAVTSNRYDVSDVIDIDSGEVYSDGSAVTGAESGLLTPGWSGISVAAALTVSLDSANPAGATLPDGASNVSLLKVRFTAGASAATVNGLTFKRLGIGAAGDWNAIYLYEGSTRITATSRTVSTDTHQVEFPVLSISVPANSSKTVTLRGDLLNGVTSGALHQFQLLSADTSATASGLPLTGNVFSVGTQDVSTITAAAATAPSNPSLGAKAAEIATFRLTAGTEDIEFNQLVTTFTGSLARAQITNLKLYQEDTLLASASSVSSEDTATFTLSSPFTILDGQNKTFRIKADLGGEVNETLTTRIDEAGHLFAVDKQYNYGARFTTAVPLTLATITLQGGDLTIADNGPVASQVGKNLQDVVLNKFSLTAERSVEVRRLDVNLCVSEGTDLAPGATTISDLRIKDADTGTTVMSQSSLASVATSETVDTAVTITAFSEACGTPNRYRLTDIFNLTAGVTKNLQITADIGTSDDLDNRWVRADVSETWYDADQSYFRDLNTGDYLFTADVIPNSVTGTNQTIVAATVTPSLSSTPVTALQYVVGANKVEGVGVVYTASDASAITIKQVGVRVYVNTETTLKTFAGATEDTSPQGEITAVYLYDGTTLLSTKTLSATAAAHDYGVATFDNLTVTVPKGSTKKLVVKLDVNSSASARLVAVGLPAASIAAYDADGNDISSDVTTDINLVTAGVEPNRYVQVLAAGTLSVVRDASSPDSDIVIAGSSNVVTSKIKFTANSENWTIEKLRVKINTSANEASVDAVKIAYPGGTATGYLAGGFVNFTGLSWTIEKDTEEILTISADLKAIEPNVAETGRAIQFGVDFDTGFEANGTSQTQLTCFGGTGASCTGGADVSGNAMYLRKTKPTVTGLDLASTTLINGTNVVNKFTVAADAAGDVYLKKFSWDINVSDITSLTSWALYEGSNLVAGTTGGFWSDGTATSTAGAVPFNNQAGVLIVELDDEEVVAAGASKTFELRAVVTGASTADSVSVSLLNDDNDTAVATDGLVDHATQGVQLDDAGAVDFLWSDKARGVNHTDSYQDTYEDWTNGYLIDTMPTPTKSRTWPS